MKPNIVYVHSHDTGRYVQPYGHAIKTPNIQKLAEEGVLFRKAFTANPTCSPSRACLLTGSYPHSNGMIALAHRGGRLNDYSQHIIHTLHKQGYTSGLVGFQHITTDRKVIGYEHLLEQEYEGQSADSQMADAERAASFMKDMAGKDQPFFLSVGFTRTHRTGGEDIQWHNGDESPLGDPRYVLPPAPLPDTPEVRQDIADYHVCAERLDACMGHVFDAVKSAGLSDNTIIICTTDHGIAYPGMKCSLTDHGLGVMLLMRGPGGFEGGKVIDGMVSQVDVFPTLCDVLGIDTPDWVQGASFLPQVAGDAAQTREEVFAEVNYHAAYEPKRAVRTERYKYIRRYDVREHPILPNCDPSVTKNLLLEHGWRERALESEYLYDLTFDPVEACNRASDPAYAAALEEMRGRLDRWMRETNDPLLNGPIEPWPDSVTNPVEGLHPGSADADPASTPVHMSR